MRGDPVTEASFLIDPDLESGLGKSGVFTPNRVFHSGRLGVDGRDDLGIKEGDEPDLRRAGEAGDFSSRIAGWLSLVGVVRLVP